MSELQHAAIEQMGKHEDTSDKYTPISTRLIIDSLESRGFELDGVNVAGVRKQSNQGFQKHLVTMRYKELETADGCPTIIIQNSHNRSSGLKFHTGFIRFACMNGLILGDGIEEQKIRHSSNWKEKATWFLDNYMHEVARLQEEHDAMMAKRISRYDMMLMAEEACKIRYDIKDILDPNELNLVRRVEDRGTDLYSAYNRIQESLIQGLFQRRITKTDDDGIVTHSEWGKASKITSTDEIIRINKEVRQLALSVA